MARHKDTDWNLAVNTTYEIASVAVLMDIRDELKILNRVFSCYNTQAIPDILRAIKKEHGEKTKEEDY